MTTRWHARITRARPLWSIITARCCKHRKFIDAGHNYRRGDLAGHYRVDEISGHETGGVLMTAEILIAITAGIIFSVAFLLYLWEKDRTRRHGKHKLQQTIRQRNVTSKRIAS
jgi:hypothetical protein